MLIKKIGFSSQLLLLGCKFKSRLEDNLSVSVRVDFHGPKSTAEHSYRVAWIIYPPPPHAHQVHHGKLQNRFQ